MSGNWKILLYLLCILFGLYVSVTRYGTQSFVIGVIVFLIGIAFLTRRFWIGR